MSFNQSRAEKSDGHVRKTGRSGSSGHNKGYPGGGGGSGKGGGVGGAAPALPLHSPSPLPNSNAVPPLSSNRRKSGHGEHFRQSPAVAASSNAGVAGPATNTKLAVPNGAHMPAASLGPSDPPVLTNGGKPVDAPMNFGVVLKAPSSLPASGGLNAAAAPPTTAEGDASRSFTLQFGTINPGIVTGMQIPARTSSAPPNLDEQKRDQVRQDPIRAVPTFPIPPVPKHQPPQMRKNGALASKSADVESNLTRTGNDGHTQISANPPTSLPKASLLPGSGIPMAMPFQQPHVQLKFGGTNTQAQTQAASSLQMPLALPVANTPQVPQQLFVPGLQAHPLQAQALMHQGQGLGFPQMSHQMPHHQIGSLGIAIGPQFSQQQTGKFGGQRKTTVKITHPETHEELRLDKRPDSYSDDVTSSQKSLPNLSIQSQPVPSFTSSHQVNYYPQMQTSTFNPSPMFYPPSSIPLTSTQIQSGNQVPTYNYSVGQGGQPVPFMSSTLNPISSSKPGTPMQVASESVKLAPQTSSATPAPVQVSIKPPNSKIEVGKSSALPTRKAEEAKSMKLPVEVSTSDKLKDQNAALPTRKAEEAKATKLPVEVSTSDKPKDQNAVYDSYQLPKPISAESDDATSARVVDSDSTFPTALPSVRKEPILITSVTAAGDLASVIAGSDGRKKEPIRRSNSMKEQHRKSSKKDIRNSQQQQQASMMESSDFVKLNTSKSTIDNSTVDAVTTEQSENSDKFQVMSMASSATSTLPPSISRLEPTLPQGEAAELVQDPSDGLDAISSVVLAEEILQETCLINSDSSESFNMVVAKDEYGFGMPTSVNEMDKTIPNFSEVLECQEERIAGVVVSKPEEPQTLVKEKNDVSREVSQDNCNAKVYPIPAVAELLESEKPIVSAGEEVEHPSKRMALVSVDAEQELAVTWKDLGNNLGADGVGQPHGSSNAADDIIVEGKVEQLHGSSNAADENIVPSGSINDTLLTGILEGDPSPSETTTYENEETSSHEVCSGDLVHDPVSSGTMESAQDVSSVYRTTVPYVQKERLHLEPARAKTTVGKKKRRKDILSKADLAVPSDLYGAYKGPEEKLDDVNLESMSSPPDGSKDVSLNVANKAVVPSEEENLSKSEVDDWEDAADSTPKLAPQSLLRPNGAIRRSGERGSEEASKKYSRDFLITLQDQCVDLPVGFEIGSDIATSLMCTSVISSDRESFPSPGRGGDRSQGGSRSDRRMGGSVEDDKRSKPSGPFGTGQGHGSFRQGQGANHGVLRNQRGKASGGIITGPVQSIPPQGGAQRNGADADRWQRSNSIQRGLISPPQSPLQVMHKAAKKYEVGKVSDEEEGKQRQLKAILNKLTPQNFEKLFVQVIDVNIDNARTLTGVISQIFDKALMEPTFCEMYANFCLRLSSELPDFSEDNEKITFKRLLLNKCQEEFERDDREQAEVNKVEAEGEIQLSDVQREEKRIKARRRMLGNIRLIGELYKKKMLTERIMHECIKKLLGQYQNPDEEDIEALCKLMSTIGEIIDHPKAKEHMDAYFDMMLKLSTNQKLSSRVQFMLKDAIDLRKNKWQQRRKVEGPKKIEEVHRDAAHERQAQAGRSGRGPIISSTPRRGPAVDYGPKGSSVQPSSSSQHMGNARGFTSQNRGFGSQDFRHEDRHQFENRTLSMPQRSTDDESITFGPKGGLARGMSMRGQPLVSSVAENPLLAGDHQKMAYGSNGYNSAATREEVSTRNVLEKLSGVPYDLPNPLDRNSRISDRPSSTTISTGRIQGGPPAASSGPKPLSEADLRGKSLYALKEYYSAKDEGEVAFCIKELNCPSFYPSMVSVWVTDSFERRDAERDLLASLLVSLNKSRHSLLSQAQLVAGFESVLSSLEDAVNDAPRAPEFLGRLFARIILEGVVSLREIGRLIHEGGEERGSLLESGLASEVLGGILEFIKTESGGAALDEIRASSELRLEEFLPPRVGKARNKLEAFL